MIVGVPSGGECRGASVFEGQRLGGELLLSVQAVQPRQDPQAMISERPDVSGPRTWRPLTLISREMEGRTDTPKARQPVWHSLVAVVTRRELSGASNESPHSVVIPQGALGDASTGQNLRSGVGSTVTIEVMGPTCPNSRAEPSFREFALGKLPGNSLRSTPDLYR